jgi:hypothetical protein
MVSRSFCFYGGGYCCRFCWGKKVQIWHLEGGQTKAIATLGLAADFKTHA